MVLVFLQLTSLSMIITRSITEHNFNQIEYVWSPGLERKSLQSQGTSEKARQFGANLASVESLAPRVCYGNKTKLYSRLTLLRKCM